MAHEKRGDYAKAITDLQAAVKRTPENPWPLGEVARFYVLTGKQSEARKVLAGLEKQWEQKHVGAYNIAEVYAALDDKDRAFEWLDRAFDDRTYWISSLKVDPSMDGLRSDPRFQTLLGRT